ncbi:phosphate ABC transporter ATP-binding protein [Anabaena cylindrica FACHB-243]|uniref:Phosphate ABC transporter ATP-binding protein, PhoT family n=1 Tax=Anabaena cylindrica (strain ATCC 27899 / PCC 7122) TaxID=272123 RepID=K9ZR26_ANACC|nr:MULTISPECIES: phosphate ABC transporter ATP-binding protein PstB [Anabaena]AFZ60810.1 phosphate ABC transporter ATP-binding protein, PhoT family [Anabaena cylindrica PCC 7122]MBD2417110.1 phosphate ABC transporter ATP-binding protein [Anabaena cylindrica FACHB-243]MBY5280806.1 phosphate ABC transporter ATP-binding protein [Anabaena sp. CCAP 1446/1C]MBY5307082.1 phosphate ABC transporter ATP-binding protein [Anabaena sp. CCAP 1446/1C]MCM2406811.1 phosphate ABC transporter ATP-binding protein
MATQTSTINGTDAILRTENLNIYYGNFLAVQNVWLDIPKNKATAFIGPSGCGKSTLLRCYNRLNDLIESFRAEGKIYFGDNNLYAPDIDPVEVRRRIGMVFQRPNPFPKSIFDNITFGAKINGYKGDMNELVERSLRQAALWDEVKDKLKQSGLSLSGGQQQRLCIARAIAVQPEVILMDEPCSALDPISTLRVEELIHELKEHYTIVIVTHNMQQAARVSDKTAFFNVKTSDKGSRTGYLVEYEETELIFNNPQQEDTKAYISGRFG